MNRNTIVFLFISVCLGLDTPDKIIPVDIIKECSNSDAHSNYQEAGSNDNGFVAAVVIQDIHFDVPCEVC